MADQGRKLRGSGASAADGFNGATPGSSANDALSQIGFFNDQSSKMVTAAMQAQKRIAVNSVESLDTFMAALNKKTKEVLNTSLDSTGKRIDTIYDKLSDTEDKIVKVIEETKKQVAELEAQLTATTDKAVGKELQDKIKATKAQSKETVGALKTSVKELNGEIKVLEKNYKDAGTMIERQTDNVLNKLGLMKNSMIRDFAKDLSKQFVNNAGKLQAGQVARMGATALGVGSMAAAAAFQNSGTRLIPENGMNLPQFQAFMDMVPKVSTMSRLGTEEIMQLGQAFANAGIPINSATQDLKGYLTESGKAVRMIGLTNDQAAMYTKTMMAQGYTSGQLGETFKTLYGTMVETHQTTTDITQALGEAGKAVADFGGTAHRNMFQFTNDIMIARGLFKTLGIDAKSAGDVISSTFGNNGLTALQRSGLIANTIGGDSAALFNQMMADPSKGAELTLQAAMTQMLKMSPTAGMSEAQLNAKFGGNQAAIRSSYLQSMTASSASANMFGINESILQQGLSDYRASGANSVDQWMAMRKKANTGSSPDKAWEKSWETFNSTMPELTAQLSRFGSNLLIIVGSPMVKTLIPLLKVTNSILDVFSKVMTSDNPLIQGLTSLVSGGLALFGVVLPLVNAMRTIIPLLGAVTGGGALAGLSAGGLIPVLIGSALTAAVGALIINFGPKLVDAIGNGFNAVFSKFNLFGFGGNPSTNSLPGTTNSIKMSSPMLSSPAMSIGTPQPISIPNPGPVTATLGATPLANYTGGAYGKADWGARATPAFKQKVVQVASRLKMNPDHLMAVMMFESGLNPSIQNRMSGATGLIQFMNAAGVGTTKNNLKNMSGVQQLDYVEKYLKPYAGKMNNIQDAYMAVFSPAYIGSKSDKGMYRQGSLAYAQNKGLDIDRNGIITVGEAASKPASKLGIFKSLQNDSSIYDVMSGLRDDANKNHAETKVMAQQAQQQDMINQRRRESASDMGPFIMGSK